MHWCGNSGKGLQEHDDRSGEESPEVVTHYGKEGKSNVIVSCKFLKGSFKKLSEEEGVRWEWTFEREQRRWE